MIDDIKQLLKEYVQLWQQTSGPISLLPLEVKEIANKHQVNLEDFDLYKEL